MNPTRAAFVMEQSLGHVTHYRNLHAVAAAQSVVTPTWLPIPFEVAGPTRLMPLLGSNWSVRASWRARRALGRALAQQPHDALFFHTQVTALFSVGLLRRYPSLISLDATPINYDTVGASYGHRPAGDSLLDQRKFELNRRAFRAAAKLVTWSSWARASLIADYNVDPARIEVLAPGAAAAYFAIGDRRTAKVVPSRVRLLFVGGDFRRKGGEQLLEAFAGSLAERAELHVVTKQRVAPRPHVHVYPNLGPNSPELLRLFAEADVFVLPSRGECLAVALMEATAAGLPVVTTTVGALGEAVRPEISGLVVQPGDTAALRAAVDRLVADAGLRTRMGRAGLDLAHQVFDANRNNTVLLHMLADLVEARRMERTAA
jgi:glycosyltransferase involved in cell wall biosynthesis